MHRRVVGPGPAAEGGAAVVGKGLLQLLLRVHHEGAVLRHRLADRAALQQQEFAGLGPVDQLDGLQRRQLDGGMVFDRLPVDGHALRP